MRLGGAPRGLAAPATQLCRFSVNLGIVGSTCRGLRAQLALAPARMLRLSAWDRVGFLAITGRKHVEPAIGAKCACSCRRRCAGLLAGQPKRRPARPGTSDRLPVGPPSRSAFRDSRQSHRASNSDAQSSPAVPISAPFILVASPTPSMAAAAAAWLSFADTSGAALAAAGGSAATARLPGELAGAVDSIAAHGLAPLVPAQLLSAAMAALQARVARLQAALAPVAAAVEAAAGSEAGEADEDEEQGATLPEELENSLAEALRVRWWRLRLGWLPP